jgi:hypothetical protein
LTISNLTQTTKEVIQLMLETIFGSATNLAPPGVFNYQLINPPILITALKHNEMSAPELLF